MGKVYTVDEIREIATPIAKRYGVAKLALFGSYAKNTAHEGSDVDFLIEQGGIEDLVKYAGFIADLEDRFGRHVDVMTYDSVPGSFIEHILDEEVKIYER